MIQAKRVLGSKGKMTIILNFHWLVAIK